MIFDSHIKANTDHHNNIYDSQKTSIRINRCKSRLLEYDYEVIYTKGITKDGPDVLSRLSTLKREPDQKDTPSSIHASHASEEKENT